MNSLPTGIFLLRNSAYDRSGLARRGQRAIWIAGRTTGRRRTCIGFAALDVRMAALPFLVLVWVLAVHGGPAAASDRSAGSTTALPEAGANAVLNAPYLSLGVALVRSQDTRFADGADAGHAALYGSGELFDAGALDGGPQFQFPGWEIAPGRRARRRGVRLPYRLRVQLELGLAREPRLAGQHELPGLRPASAVRGKPGHPAASPRRVLRFPGMGDRPRAAGRGPFWAPGSGSPTTA